MRIKINHLKYKALYVVAFVVVFSSVVVGIGATPVTGRSKPVHPQWQSFPNSYGYFGYQDGFEHGTTGKEIIALEYPPFINFTSQTGLGPDYYITLYLDLSSQGLVHLPLNVQVTFSITGLRNTSIYTIAHGTQHLVSQSSYWTYLPDNFVFLTNAGLDTSSYNSVKPYTGSNNDTYGNWTTFGIFDHHGGSVHGSTLLQLLTNGTLASHYFAGTRKNINATCFEQTTIQQFKFKVVLQWQDQYAGIFNISGGNRTLYLGQGSVFDLNKILLVPS